MENGVKRARPSIPSPREGMDWANMKYGAAVLKMTQMVVLETDDVFKPDHKMDILPYGPLQVEPAATVFNYSQTVFEGMKARRTRDGRIVVFRPERNAQRFADGAARMCLPEVPKELFLRAVGAAVRSNADLVPPFESGGGLYIRPVLMGTGGSLALHASPHTTFVTFVTPVGAYFKNVPAGGAAGAAAAKPAGVRFKIERKHQRAAPRGNGNVKTGGNYAACFPFQKVATSTGYTDIIYMDAATGKTLEEVAAANIFLVMPDGKVATPSLEPGTILPGITRASVIELLQRFGKEVGASGIEERSVTEEDLGRAVEVFVTGTAAGVTSVAHIGDGEATNFDFVPDGKVTKALKQKLEDFQWGEIPDTQGWLRDPFGATFDAV